jgi:cysteine synthase B
MYYKNAVDAIGHTPLVELPRSSPNKKVRILVKLEGQNTGGSASVKDRIAKYMMEKAEESGLLTRDKIIIEATSGNTGISIAWLGRQKGYETHIVMPDSMSMERRRLLSICGAKLFLTDGKYGMEGAISTAREMLAKDSRYYMLDQFTNPGNPMAHYETTGAEILDDFPYEQIDVFVASIGTGGTFTGVGRRLRERFPDVKILTVEPNADDPIQGLRNLNTTFIPPVIDMDIIDKQYTVTSRQANDATRLLLDSEGIFGGQSSGAVFHQTLEIARQMDEGNIVAVLPDGGWKYLSMSFWTEGK